MADLRLEIYAEFLRHAHLSDKHRRYLRQQRRLEDQFIEGHFISGTQENIVPALEETKQRYAAHDVADALHILKTEHGCQLDPRYLNDEPLFVYRDRTGQPFMVKRHKKLPDEAVPQPFGLQLIKAPEATTVITEGEYKALLLNQLGVQSLSVSGVSIFNDQHYHVLRDHIRDLGLMKLVFLYDNADRRSPALPNGQPNPKYVSEKTKRVDVEYGQLHVGRRLAFDVEGLDVRHARLPDASRIDGEADVDGVIVGGTLMPEKLLRLIAEPFTAEEFIAQLHPEEQETLRHRLGLGDKEFRAGGKTYFELRRWPLKVTARNAKSSRWGIQADVAMDVNGVDIHSSFMNLTDDRCKGFARDAEGRFAEKLPSFRVGELTGRTLPLLQDLKLLIGRAMEKTEKAEREKAKEKAQKYEDATVGEKSYLYAPGEIILQQKTSDKAVANFFMRVTHDVQVEDDLDAAHQYRAELVTAGKTLTVEFPAEERLNKGKLEGHISAAAPDLWVDDMRAVTDVAAYIAESISKPQELRVTRNFGYNSDGAYVTPSIVIQPDGLLVQNNTIPIDLSKKRR